MKLPKLTGKSFLSILSIAAVVFATMIFLPRLINKEEGEYSRYEEEEGLPGALRAMDLWGDMRMYPFSTMKAASYSRALEMSRRMSYAARGANTTAPWTDLAPKNFAGRVLSIGFHPTDPNIMWVGSAAGGLWKTINGGTGAANGINWQYVQTGFPVLGVSSIIVAPDGNTLYIGTGELYKDPQSPTLGTGVTGSGHDRSFRGTYGIGILKSTDGGNTWVKSLDFSSSATVAIMDMVIDPSNPNILYAATTQGLYRTVNAGLNWLPVSITNNPRLAMDLVYKPGSSSELYATFGNFGTAGTGIYKSINANGATPTFSRLSTGLPATVTGKIQLAVTPAAPNNVYASVGHSPTGIKDVEGFYRTVDNGATWSGPAASNMIGQQGWYAHDIAVSNNSADTIYWGELDLYRAANGTTSAVTFGLRSSWSSWNVNNTTVGTLQEGVNNGYVHADIHRIVPSPHNRGTVFVLTDGGVFRSTNNCETFQTLNGGLQTAQIYASAAVSAIDPNFMLMGLQDNEGLVYAGTPGCRRVPNLGDGFHAAISPSNQNTCYIASYNLNVKKSIDKAVTFANTPLTGFGDYNGPITACFNSPFVLAPSNPSVVYGGTALLRKSTDALGTVAVIGGTTAYVSGLYSPILTMAVSSQNANKMYCSTTPSTSGTFIRSKLWRTVTSSTAFTEKTDITGTLPDRYYSDIAVDPTNDQRIAVTLSGFNSSHVFLSLDGGNNWTDIGQGLPDIPHNAVVFDPTNRDIIYVGNDQGVYYAQGVPLSGTPGASFNLTWNSYNEGLGDGVIVSDILITNTRKLRLATYGRGLWERDMVAPIAQTSFTVNNTSQCINNNLFQFTATSSSCTGTLSYLWNFGDGTTASGQTASKTYTSAGTYPVTLTVSNTTGCSDFLTQNVTANPLPAAPTITAGGSLSVCEPSTVTLTSSSTTGNQWYRNGTIITGATGATYVANSSGSYTCVFTGSTGCSSPPSNSLNVAINPRPQITVNNPILCSGDSATLTVSGVADAYTWSPVTAMFPTTGAAVKVAPTATTSYTVTARFSATGCQNTATSTVTVRTKPSITATLVNPTTCGATGSITLRGLAVSTNYTINYTKDGVPIAPVVRTSSTNGTILISSLTAGVYTNINATLNGCVSNSLGPITLTNPNPPALTIPKDTTLCAGRVTGTITFSATPTSTFSWTNDNTSIGLAASGATSSIASFTAVNTTTSVQTATISVTATASGCTSAPKTMRINVNPRPQISVNSPIVCGRDSATLTVTGAADTYTWSPITAMFPTSGAVVKVAPTATTTYTVTARFTGTGCQNTATGTATVRTKPAITATFSNPTTCGATGSITLSGLAASTSYTLNYAKDGIPITSVARTSSTTGTILISSLTAGIYTNINVTLNGCTSNSLGPITLTNPNPPVLTVPPDVTVCAVGATGTITFTATPASTFNWTNNNTSIGLAASGTTSSIASFTAVNNGITVQTATISVTATASGCISAPKTMRINVNPRPQITVNSPILCSGDSATLTVSGAADTYTWSPVTAMLPTLGALVKVAPTATTSYTVTARFTATGCQNTATSTVTVRAKPIRPTITQSGSNLVSSSTTGNQWFLNGNIITGAVAQTYTPASSGSYTVQVTTNGCSSLMSNPFDFTLALALRNNFYKNESIKLYPNPITNDFKVSFILNDNTKELNMKVFNSAGAMIKEFKNIQSEQLIKSDGLPNGNLIFILESPVSKRQFLYKMMKN